MLTRTHVSVLLGAALVVWAATLYVLGTKLTPDFLKPFFGTVAILTGLCFAFDRWLWHWNIFKRWLVKQPYIAGTWKVVLISNWVDPKTGQKIPPIICLMVIRQTYSMLSLRLFTKESSSASVAHKFMPQDDGIFRLFAGYQNTPRIELRGARSEIHFGSLLLDIHGDPVTRLYGHYWTDRGTKGSLELTERTDTLFESYDAAQEHFQLP